ncbi:GL17917 [Drosophila persimilis]|uniref:GL17917 n=1 Tax=Drosophila persimilis TaxID=7234 RepID=B4H1Q2_DROPE|nr:GL17917 [Drosophila persimilis]
MSTAAATTTERATTVNSANQAPGLSLHPSQQDKRTANATTMLQVQQQEEQQEQQEQQRSTSAAGKGKL